MNVLECSDLPGAHLYQYFETLNKSVAILISSDLAHTHQSDGPYGFSKVAEPFDRVLWEKLQKKTSFYILFLVQNCGNWAATLHPSYLLGQAAKYAQEVTQITDFVGNPTKEK